MIFLSLSNELILYIFLHVTDKSVDVHDAVVCLAFI